MSFADHRKPVLQALLLADHVYQDSATGKFVVCGIFTRMTRLLEQPTPSSPEVATRIEQKSLSPGSFLQLGNPYLYFALTDYQGQIDLELRYIDLSDNSSLITGKLEGIVFKNPHELVQGSITIPKLPAPHAGEYSLDVLFDGEVLGAIRVSVTDHDLSSEETHDANS